jgi:hypothetical protein
VREPEGRDFKPRRQRAPYWVSHFAEGYFITRHASVAIGADCTANAAIAMKSAHNKGFMPRKSEGLSVRASSQKRN